MSRGVRIKFSKKYCILLSANLFTFTNSADDEIQHFAAFYLGLHCFRKYSFKMKCSDWASLRFNQYQYTCKVLKNSFKDIERTQILSSRAIVLLIN